MDKIFTETQRKLAAIEVEKFKETINAIGKKTIVEMARAGPEMQAKLLKGLGLNGYMIVDGKHPLNLFNTAKGMVGAEGNGMQDMAAVTQKFNN